MCEQDSTQLSHLFTNKMCQLLALNCAEPNDVTFSFTGFTARGGVTDHHVDGWGVAYFEEKSWRLFVDNQPASSSPMAAFLKEHPIRSRNVIAHIRKATQGSSRVENCHPFMREFKGRQWVFAHNGDIDDPQSVATGPFEAVGSTDSEAIFCSVLNALSERCPDRETTPDAIFDQIEALTAVITKRGIFNFLLSNGECLYAYCSTRLSYIIRQWPFSSARLVDDDLCVDFAQRNHPTDKTAVIATVPLTDEAWTKCQPGDLLMFRNGDLVARRHVPVPPEVLARSRYALSEMSLSAPQPAEANG